MAKVTIGNVVDAAKMPGNSSEERNNNAIKEAERMAKEHPEAELTFIKMDHVPREQFEKGDDLEESDSESSDSESLVVEE